ncbi:MAG TPA: beta-glucosidase [Candidatus Marinimicrobia bacterium]|nr:beta-glucosidase [Candidatus Neomarinimicrobiota bacterium]
MKLKQWSGVISLGLLIALSSCQVRQENTIDAKVKQLLAQMTLEEKIGQMTQISIQVVSKTRGTVDQKHEIDHEKLVEAITKYHVGSILNVWDVAHSPEYWQELIIQIQNIAIKDTRLGIPVIYGIDAIHGANYTLGATIFPQNIAMAATWNPELVRRSAAITAREVRACGIPWNFNPVLGVGRQPLWPRLFETFGEDVFLVSVLGEEYIKGLQGTDLSVSDRVAGCAKHYLGDSFPFSGKDRTPAWIPERMLRELFVPPYRAAVNAGVATIMANSSEINGIPVHSSYFLLTELLRGELGFKGFVVSDWNDINNLYRREKVAGSQKEAVKMAVMAGIDMSMVPYDYSFYELLLELVNEGSVPLARIDEAVSRILRVKFQLGLFKNPYPESHAIQLIASAEAQALNRQAAAEAITLLKNRNHILPLAKNRKVFVTGPTANALSVLNGGWTIVWQGNEEALYPSEKLTILEAIQVKIGKDKTSYTPGVAFDIVLNILQAVQMAQNADVAIICIGEPAYCETPGNIDNLTMTKAQLELVKAISTTGVPIVLVLAEGRPRIISEIVDLADAILMAYLPGLEGGPAIADVLFGDVNPGGKLPISYPQYPNSLMTYDHKTSEIVDVNDYDVQWSFGFGMSYTTFDYANLRLDTTVYNPDSEIRISVDVTNSGDRSGLEVVQLYISDKVASVTPPVKRLKGFQKIYLEPGQIRTVDFMLTPLDLEFVGRENTRITEPGEFAVEIGGLTRNFILE